MFLRETTSPKFSRAFARKIALAFGTNPAAALMPVATVHLWKDPTFHPGIDTPLADFTAKECDFDDYAAAALVPAVPANAGPTIPAAAGSALFGMVTTPTVTTNTVYGYWIASGGAVVMFEEFGAGQQVIMAFTGDQLLLAVEIPVLTGLGTF